MLNDQRVHLCKRDGDQMMHFITSSFGSNGCRVKLDTKSNQVHRRLLTLMCIEFHYISNIFNIGCDGFCFKILIYIEATKSLIV